MILRFELPSLGPQVDRARVLRWHAGGAGTPVRYGDPLCELAVEQISTLRRTDTASRIAGIRRGRATNRRAVQPLLFHALVSASDNGVMRQTLASEGDVVQLGSLLALLTAGADDPIGPEADQSVLRTVVNMIEG